MAKTSKPDIWLEAKTLYEMGKGIREISRQLDLPVSSLSRKSKEWQQSILEQPINAIAKATQELEQSVPQELMPLVSKEIDNRLGTIRSLNNLTKGGLKLQGLILKNTIDALEGKLDPAHLKMQAQASMIASNLGLSTANIAKIAGISDLSDNKTENDKKSNRIVQIVLPHNNRD